MQAFKTKAALIEAVAQYQHQANLESGGVFDAEGNRFSDLNVERRVAASQSFTWVSPHYSGAMGKPAGWHYRNFGYVPA
jgi:hypothetical protein